MVLQNDEGGRDDKDSRGKKVIGTNSKIHECAGAVFAKSGQESNLVE